MKKWSREKKRGVAIIAVMLCILGLLAGLLIDMLSPLKEPQAPDVTELKQTLVSPPPTPEPPAQDVLAGQDKSLLPEMEVILRCDFSRCGHSLMPEPPKGLSGLTEAELESLGYSVKALSQESAYLSCTIDGYCPAHLILLLREGQVLVVQRDGETLENRALMTLRLDGEALEPLLQAELEAGVEIQSLEEVDAYLESAES